MSSHKAPDPHWWYKWACLIKIEGVMLIPISDDLALFCLQSKRIAYLYTWSVNTSARLQTLNEAKSYTELGSPEPESQSSLQTLVNISSTDIYVLTVSTTTCTVGRSRWEVHKRQELKGLARINRQSDIERLEFVNRAVPPYTQCHRNVDEWAIEPKIRPCTCPKHVWR